MSIPGWRPYGLAVAGAILALAAAMTSAAAQVSSADLGAVGVYPPPGAVMPVGTAITDLNGVQRDLRALIDRPTALVFTDYTCTTLCGPVLAFVGHALEQSGLAAGVDYKLIVIGLDPRDGAEAARDMRHRELGDDTALAAATTFVTADAPTVTALTRALGYRYVYDAAHDQFAHPAAAFIFGADGRLARVLSGLGLSGADIRLALVEAGKGKIGNLNDQIHLLCYGFDPAQGIYNLAVSRLLSATALASVLGLGGLIGFLAMSGRGRRA